MIVYLGFPVYLQNGTETQQRAYNAIKESGIFEHLQTFHPTLAGTIPLDIDIPGSDLDILCHGIDFPSFAGLIQQHYGHLPDFYQNTKLLNEIPAHVSRFTYTRFSIEIVAQPLPIIEQRAYRHMLAEARLLEQGGETARDAIRALKLSGMKTEPAFAKYFGLKGDPFQALLDLEDR
jgi:hypothetical protein